MASNTHHTLLDAELTSLNVLFANTNAKLDDIYFITTLNTKKEANPEKIETLETEKIWPFCLNMGLIMPVTCP